MSGNLASNKSLGLLDCNMCKLTLNCMSTCSHVPQTRWRLMFWALIKCLSWVLACTWLCTRVFDSFKYNYNVGQKCSFCMIAENHKAHAIENSKTIQSQVVMLYSRKPNFKETSTLILHKASKIIFIRYLHTNKSDLGKQNKFIEERNSWPSIGSTV